MDKSISNPCPLGWIVLFLFLTNMPLVSFASEDNFKHVPAVIHLDSDLGGGVLTPEQIIKIVREAGFKVAIFSDKDSNKVEYGIFPLRNIIKKTVEKESINHYGANEYISRIKGLSVTYPDMAILHGTETVPFYFWEGSPLSKLRIKNFHKDILVYGLEEAEDYENLPSVSNKRPREFSINCFINLWPLFLIALGLAAFSYKKMRNYPYLLTFSKSVVTEARIYTPFKAKLLGILFITGGFVFLVNNYPFCNPKFDQYHGDKGSAPYQTLIDYVNSKGGLTFWSSPDADYATYEYGPVTFETQPYFNELLNTTNYTGFAVFAEGMKHTGIPGGIWDKVLTEYVNGIRERPVWAIGELDYEEGDWMGETQTVLLLNQITRGDVLDALKTGRMYAVIGPAKELKPVLEEFLICDSLGNKWATMGETAKINGVTKIRIKINILAGEGNHVLKIIREGEVIREITLKKGLFNETIEIDYLKPGGKTYYRIDLNSRLVSNPIFCDFRS